MEEKMMEEKTGYHVEGIGDGSAVGVLGEPITPKEHARLEEEWFRVRLLGGEWPHAERLLVTRRVYGYASGLSPRTAVVELGMGVE